MTKRELAEALLIGVPKDELDDVMQLLVYRQRKPSNIRPSVPLRDGFRTLTAQEFDEFLLEHGPEMQPCDGEG
jgi:hypothetical protein